MKTKDSQLRKKIENSFAEYFGIQPTSQTLDGVEIIQAHFSVYQKLLEKQEDLSVEAAKIQEFMGVFKEHGYWYEERGVIYMSQVPQVLAMKKNNPNQISLKSWLANNQGGDWESAIFAYGKDIKHMPQDMYHFYLMLLQGLGDLAQVEVDLFALPTAEGLNLPDSGRISLVLSSDAEKVSFKFGYEYSVLEPILAGDGALTTIAVIGILAAYAIPAYRDYEVRAKLAQQMVLASSLKSQVQMYWLDNQTFEGIQDEVYVEGLNFYIDEETGEIAIELESVSSAFYDGDEIYFEPSIEDNYFEWYCYSYIKQSYLPYECRD